MQVPDASKWLASLALLAAGSFLSTSCTTTTTSSGLTALSKPNVPAAAEVEQDTAATDTLTVGAAAPGASSAGEATPDPAAASASQIVGTPPSALDPVAIDRPALEKPANNPVVLASVPRTPVGNRPTNQIMMIRTTAYTHSESDHLKYGRKSAAGNTLQYGSVRSAAADWSKYPLGTRFKIEGLPYEYVVDDYGSALVGTETIDIYKPEKGTMNTWGVRNVPIRVIEWGSFEESRKILDGRKHVRHADHVREMLREIEKKGKSGQISVSGPNA